MIKNILLKKVKARKLSFNKLPNYSSTSENNLNKQGVRDRSKATHSNTFSTKSLIKNKSSIKNTTLLPPNLTGKDLSIIYFWRAGGTIPGSSKKADLREHALGIIIAVVGILLLLVASYSIYSGITSNTETKRATTIVETLEAKINALEGEKTESTIQQISTETIWHITGWDKTMIDRPDKCFTESCICACPGFTHISCEENSICRELPTVDKIELPEREETICEEYLSNDKLGAAKSICRKTMVNSIPLSSPLTKLLIEKTTQSDQTTLKITSQ